MADRQIGGTAAQPLAFVGRGAARKGSIMGTVSPIGLVAVAAVALIALTTRTDPAPVDPPSPGERCPTLNAITQDNHGHPMWCIHMVDGPSDPVWQYTGVW
jgi:hypothetical protein